MRFILLLASLWHGIALSEQAAPQWQDLAVLKQVAEAYVRTQTAELPGRVSISLGTVEPRLHLPYCPKPEAFTPTGARLWGNAAVGVRCTQPNWSLSIPVTVKAFAEVVIAARPLARNHTIQSDDLGSQEADLTQLPAGALTDPAQAVGKIARIGIPASSPLKSDMLRAPIVVLQGQKVQIVTQGPGFKVNGEGKALSNGSVGQTVSVKASSGKVLSGVVKSPGLVEVPFE